jgi:hypothetical protein
VQSGFPALEAGLSEFLRTGKAREFLLRAADRTAQIAHQQELSIRISQRAGNLEQAAGLEERLKELSASLTHDREGMVSAMRHRLPREFRERCAAIASLWNLEVEASFGSQLEAWFPRDQGDVFGNDFEEFVQKTFQQLFSDWLSLHRVQINRVFEELTQKENKEVEDLTAKVVALPAGVLGEDDGASLPRSFDAHPPVFRGLRISLGSIEVPWWYELVPSDRWREYLARRWEASA